MHKRERDYLSSAPDPVDRDRQAGQAGRRLGRSSAWATRWCSSPPATPSQPARGHRLPAAHRRLPRVHLRRRDASPAASSSAKARPTEKEILTSRVIDRPIRPLFPSGWRNETQIIAFVLSADTENDSDVLAITGASRGAGALRDPVREDRSPACASASSTASTSSTRPTPQRKQSRLDLVVAGTKDGIVMVEAGANEVTEEEAVTALDDGARRDQADLRRASTRSRRKPARSKLPKPERTIDHEFYARGRGARAGAAHRGDAHQGQARELRARSTKCSRTS